MSDNRRSFIDRFRLLFKRKPVTRIKAYVKTGTERELCLGIFDSYEHATPAINQHITRVMLLTHKPQHFSFRYKKVRS